MCAAHPNEKKNKARRCQIHLSSSISPFYDFIFYFLLRRLVENFFFHNFCFALKFWKIFCVSNAGNGRRILKLKFFFKFKKNYFKSRPLLHLAPVGCCIITDHSHAVIRWRIFTFSRHMCSVRFFFFFFREVEKFQTPAEGKEKWRILLPFAFPGLSHRLLYAFWGLRLINWWNVESSD